MNKKRYLIIIAIIIFIFLALFTFANPLENEEGEPNDNRVLEEIEEEDVINNVQNDKNTDEESEEETPVYNNHGVNINTILKVEDNSYELALNAVIKAEVSLQEDKYIIALDLVSKVTDEDKKEELEERLELVLDTMELIELVKELVEMTGGAKNLKELDTARDYQVSNEIIDRITKLVNNTLKESLNDEVDTVLYLLNDKTAPKINIEDEAILKDVVVLDVKDDNEFTITLTKEGEEPKKAKNGDEVSDGVYTLTVRDESFNEKTITFTIDTTAPTGEITYSTTEITNGEVVATLVPSEDVKVTNNKGSFEYTFKENGSFTFEFVDRAGNKGTKTATVENIDTEKPVIKIGGTTGEDYWFYEQTFEVKITEENIDSVYYIWNQSNNEENMKKALDGKSATKVDLSTLIDNGDGTYTLSVTRNIEGRYVFNVKVVDKAGNVEYGRKGWYQIDRTAPTGEITYSTTEIINGEVVATLVPSEDVKVTNNKGSFEYTFKENGSFTFEFVDRAGNKGTATATVKNIDTDEPVIEIGGTTGEKYWFQEQTFNTVITEENIDSVYYIWNDSSNDGSMKRDLDSEKATKVDVSTLTDNGNGTYTLSVTLNTEGRYVFNVKVVDKAGNVEYERRGWYQIDRTAPSMQVGDIVYGPEHTDVIYSPDRFKATAVDTASGIDKIYSNGHERPRIDVNGNGNYTFTLVDKAGNTSEFKVIVDKIDPSYNYVGIMNIDQTTEGYAKVGDRVWVYVTLNEQLSKEPTIKINGETATIINRESGENWYKYVGEVKMKEEMPEGEIKFTVDGYKDLAGRSGDTLTNANINHGVSSIKLDKTRPGYNYVGIMNIDQKTEGYAKVGDRVWVYVTLNEQLSKEPTIKINGETASIIQRDFGANWYKYVGEVVMKEEMPEGEIKFTVDGYEDLAGLEGYTLTNANINHGVSSIKLDKTSPTYRTYKGTITQDKYEVEPIIIDGELYFFGKTTFNFNDNLVIKEQHVDNGVYIGWQQGVQKVFNTPGKHTVKMVDAAGNETSVTLTILDERLNITNVDELKTALNELDEITLYKDLDLGTDNPLLITSGQNKVINLNGRKITGKSTKSSTSNLIEVKSGASLRLEGNGEISFLAIEPDTDWDPEGFPTYANNTIKNSGKLVIDGPTIINNTPKGGASYAIDNYPGADLEVLSGTITQAGGDVAIRLFANSTTVATKVTINGGTISGYRAVWIHIPGSNPLNAKLAYLTVNGGVLNSTDLVKNDALYSYSFGDSFANTNITITGGTFNGDVAFGGGYKGDKENVTITGGTFNGEVGRYLENNGWEDLRP